MKKILITVTNTGKLHKRTADVLLKIQQDRRYNISIQMPTEQPYENNLNHIARDFLNGGFDYWLQIDNDNAPVRNPLDLIELDKDIMCLPYAQWHCSEQDIDEGNYPIVWLAMDDVGEGFKEHKNMQGLQQIGAGGSGCMIIARRVLEQFEFPFTRTFDKYGRVEIGVDFNFCRRARKKGFEVWCHYDYPALHFKEVEMLEVQNAFRNFYAKKYAKQKTSGKDIVFFCGPSREFWDGNTGIERGIGGSEGDVIYTARELVKLGWNVIVYNNCKESKIIDGVFYKKFYDWNRFDKQDVTVIERRPNIARQFINSNKIIIDLHDVGFPEQMDNIKFDKIFVASKFHASLYPSVPKEKFVIIPRGFNPELFKEKVEKDPYLLINTSAPDRCLGTLIKLFLEVKKRVPQAKLTWAYGWNLFDSLYEGNEKMMQWKKDIIESMKVNGIENLDRINHKEIAKLYQKATIFVYPTHFPETFCVSVLKAQVAGAIPVTSDFGALGEIVSSEYSISVPYKESIRNYDYGIVGEKLQLEWVDKIVKYLTNPVIMKQDFSKYSWQNIAKLWDKELK